MRCPVCKADNREGPQCRRCKADLTDLYRLEEQRRAELESARRCLHAGRWQQAADHAAAADWLRGDEESRQLLALAYLLNRDFGRAWRCYTGERGEGPSA